MSGNDRAVTVEPAIRQVCRRWKVQEMAPDVHPDPGDWVITYDDGVYGLWAVPAW
jgi:hypothetical protein